MVSQGQTRWSIPPVLIAMLSPSFYSALARSILSGEPAADAVAARMRRTLGENWRWIRTLAERYVRAFWRAGIRRTDKAEAQRCD